MAPIGEYEAEQVRRAVRWLLPGDPLRAAAARALAGGEPALPTDQLLAPLASGRGWWRRRWVCAWLLGLAPQSELQRAEAVGCMMARVGQRPGNLSGWLVAGGCVAAPLTLALWIAAWAAALRARRADSVRAAMVDALGRLEAREAVATLLAVTQSPRIYPADGHPELRAALTRTLPRLLALLTGSDYGLLPEAVTPHLAAVARQAPEPVAVAALGALERAGDGRAVEAVTRLAQSRRPSERRSAAQRALAALLPRHERETQAATLVRPAVSPDMPEDVLLRPAGGAPTPDADLLRPSAQPGAPLPESDTPVPARPGTVGLPKDGGSAVARVGAPSGSGSAAPVDESAPVR